MGDAITTILHTWRAIHDQKNITINVGVVAYNDNAQQIHVLGAAHPIDTVYKYTNHGGHTSPLELKQTGESDLAKAFDFVRLNSFNTSRPGVPKVVVPIVHQMKEGSHARDKIIKAGQKLVDECISIVAFAVNHQTLDLSTLHQSVNSPSRKHILYMEDYHQLECKACKQFQCGVDHSCHAFFH